MRVGACLGLAFIACVFLVGCPSDQPALGSGDGELGRGDLFLVCEEEDPLCEEGAASTKVDGPVALGSSFQLTYTGLIPAAPTGGLSKMVLVSGSPQMLSKEEDLFIGWIPGDVAVLARTEVGTVTDFIHVRIARIDHVQIDREGPEHSLAVGQQETLRAVPLTATGEILGGKVAYSWEIEGQAVEVVAQQGRAVTVAALEAGSALLRVRAGEATGEISISVEDKP